MRDHSDGENSTSANQNSALTLELATIAFEIIGDVRATPNSMIHAETFLPYMADPLHPV